MKWFQGITTLKELRKEYRRLVVKHHPDNGGSEVFRRCLEVKKKLWGGNFWSSGYYVATVSEHGNEEVIANYVKNQGDEYRKLYRSNEIEGQMNLYDYE